MWVREWLKNILIQKKLLFGWEMFFKIILKNNFWIFCIQKYICETGIFLTFFFYIFLKITFINNNLFLNISFYLLNNIKHLFFIFFIVKCAFFLFFLVFLDGKKLFLKTIIKSTNVHNRNQLWTKIIEIYNSQLRSPDETLWILYMILNQLEIVNLVCTLHSSVLGAVKVLAF